jgi:hypothetical protein
MNFLTHFPLTFPSVVSAEFKLNVDRIGPVIFCHWDDMIVPFSLLLIVIVWFYGYFDIYFESEIIHANMIFAFLEK